MKHMTESDKNNQPMQTNNYYGTVIIIQGSNNPSINTESAKENRSSISGLLIKVLITLGTIIAAWFKGAG